MSFVRNLIFGMTMLIGFGQPVFAQKQSATSGAKKPNILFCIADDASLAHMGAYGQTDWVSTPGFDRVAKEGLLFMNAYTPNAKCSPSRASILTGRNPWQLEEAGNHNPFFPAKFATVMETLLQHGYATGHTGKGWSPGNPGEINGKERELTGKRYSQIKMQAPTRGMGGVNYTANFETFLKEKPADQPFCFWYGGVEPHRPYTYGSGVAKGKKKLTDIDRVPSYWPDNDSVRNDMLDYGYEVEYFDRHLKAMIELLEKRGELENTVIVITSDNGMPFPRVKGHVYEQANHLPLAVMWKGHIQNPGRKIVDYISFIDFAPTFLDLAGIPQNQSGMQEITGRSFADIFQSKKEWVDPERDHVLVGRERTDPGRPNDWGYPVRGIVKNGFIYTHNYEPGRWPSGNPETGYMDTDNGPTKKAILSAWQKGEQKEIYDLSFAMRGADELYHFATDTFSMKNLSADKKYAALLQQMKKQMEAKLIKQGDPRMFGRGDVFDKYQSAKPEARNYYERFMKGEIKNARGEKMNIVLFIADDLGVNDIEPYGNKVVRTPNLDKFSQQSLLFTSAFASSPTCGPSRSSIFTGLMPFRHGAHGNHSGVKTGTQSLVQYLQPLGYRVAIAGKLHVGPEDVFAFEHVSKTNVPEPGYEKKPGLNYDLQMDPVDKWLSQQQQSKPFLLVVADHSPHVIWPEKYTYDPDKVDIPAKHIDTRETRISRARYYTDVSKMDHNVGRLLSSLEKNGLAENTIVIFTADQGPQWPFAKWSLYDDGVKTPLMIRWPGVVKPGKQTDALVSLADLLPTIVEAAGSVSPQNIDGQSFLSVLKGVKKTHREYLFATHTGDRAINRAPARMLRTGKYKYILNLAPDILYTTHMDLAKDHDGGRQYWESWRAKSFNDAHAASVLWRYHNRPKEELYDLEKDPLELHNLANDPKYTKLMDEYRLKMTEWRKQQNDFMTGPEEIKEEPGKKGQKPVAPYVFLD